MVAAKSTVASNDPASVRLVVVNGQLGFMLIIRSEPFPTIVSLEFKENRVQRIYLMRNPDKMQHLNLEPYHK